MFCQFIIKVVVSQWLLLDFVPYLLKKKIPMCKITSMYPAESDFFGLFKGRGGGALHWYI